MSDTGPTKIRHPLGLPAGSVRGLLTMMVVGFVVAQTAKGESVGLLWSETLMIVLAHYFTSRRFVELPPGVRAELEAQGLLPVDQQPLYLPKHTIRGVIVLAFAGLAYWLHREGRLFERQSVAILGTVAAYFLGLFTQAVVKWWTRRRGQRTIPWWDDLKAVVTLGVVTLTLVVELLGWKLEAFGVGIQPQDLENATLGIVLFYFGSR
jgi:hypothetical protein